MAYKVLDIICQLTHTNVTVTKTRPEVTMQRSSNSKNESNSNFKSGLGTHRINIAKPTRGGIRL